MLSPTPKLISLAASAAASLAFATSASAADIGVAIKSDNTVARFSTAAPGVPLSPPKAITGLAASETPMAVDFRPSSGRLYLLATNDPNHTGHLYTLDPNTGVATPVGKDGLLNAELTADAYDIDFNPVTDKIRLLTAELSGNPTSVSGVIDPDTLALSNPVTPKFVAGDPNAGHSPFLGGGAYSNNRPGATSTTFFAMSGSELVRMGSPNGTPDSPDTGKLTTIGDVPNNSISFFPEALDIAGDTAYATVNRKLKLGNVSRDVGFLVRLDLSNAQATDIGPVLDDFITDMAIVPPAAAPSTPPSTPPAGGGAGPVPPADLAPVLSSVSLTRKAFAPLTVKRARKAKKPAKRVRRGSTLRYTLSEDARMEIVISRKVRRGRHTRFVKRGVLRVRAKSGRNATRMTGQIAGRKLAAGVYRATLTAIDAAGHRSTMRTLAFRVLND